MAAKPTTTKRKAKVAIPRTRRISGKVIPFRPDVAADLLSSESIATITDSLAFWIRRLLAASCPGCGVTGALNYEERTYGIYIWCQRAGEDRCSYSAEHMSVRELI